MPERAFTGDGFTVTRLVAGPLDNNVYIVHDEASGKALVVDAASEPAAIVDAVTGMDVVGIATTHGHADHHGAAPEVAAELDVEIMLHPDDRDIAGLPHTLPYPEPEMQVGDTPIRVVHTPGHTPGSICMVLDGVALTGDTLFPGGPGATRFPYSDFDRIIESIERELFSLPPDTVVLPGHGAATTVGTELPQLQDWIDRRW